MGIYNYKGIKPATGATVKGKVEAEGIKDAKAKLKKQGILATDLKGIASKKEKGKGAIASFFESVPALELAVMTRQFATLQRSGVPLDESLNALSSQVDNEYLKTILVSVKEEISGGISLSKALAGYPKVFNQLYVSMIHAGESSGALDICLERLADFTESSVELRNTIIGAMMYPLIMIFASCGIIGFLFIFILPKITSLFKSFKITLPFATRVVIWLSKFLQEQWGSVIIVAVVSFLIFNKWKSTVAGKKIWHAFILKVPVVGEIAQKESISTFTKTLSTLQGSGVPLVQALSITKDVVSNVIIRAVVINASNAVIEGKPFAKPLLESGLFPPLVTHMIQTGEKTGELETMLMHVANTYEKEVKYKIAGLTSVLEPFMIIVMAGIIALVVVAILIPMFEIFGTIG